MWLLNIWPEWRYLLLFPQVDFGATGIRSRFYKTESI